MAISDTLTVMTAQAADGTASLMGMLPIILMFVVLYFLMIRPQMKRQKEHRNLVAALAKGDEVITAGGLLGKVTKVSDNYVTIEISTVGDQPVETLLQRNSVTNVLPKGTIKSL
ncbi:MAG TPA: preprotein translocase subunit YajC [Burkholderiaceae bacterium]|nr:preprotein translocase subunit YajC [Burkholderiaceae bacterium]